MGRIDVLLQGRLDSIHKRLAFDLRFALGSHVGNNGWTAKKTGERGRNRSGKTPSQSLSPDVDTYEDLEEGKFISGGRVDDSSTPPIKRSSTSEETYRVVGEDKSSSDVPAKYLTAFSFVRNCAGTYNDSPSGNLTLIV